MTNIVQLLDVLEAYFKQFNPPYRDNWKQAILNNYSSYKQEIKEDMRISYLSSEDIIDRHKVASCLTLAILESNPIKRNNSNITSVVEELSTEYFALVAGLMVMAIFMRKDGCFTTEGLEGAMELLADITTYNDEGAYVLQLMRLFTKLIKNNTSSCYPYNSLSHIYFFIEKDYCYRQSDSPCCRR